MYKITLEEAKVLQTWLNGYEEFLYNRNEFLSEEDEQVKEMLETFLNEDFTK